MEFGRNSFEQMIKMKRQHSEFETLTILRQLLEAGALLEQSRISHNDIKPANIILNRHYNQVKLIDFGQARHVSKTKDPTLHRTLKWRGGTVAYASPQLLAAWLQTDTGKNH